MSSKLVKRAFVSIVFVMGAAAMNPTRGVRAADESIRYCCTPQQVAQCAAIGGTSTCRLGVCQCLF